MAQPRTIALTLTVALVSAGCATPLSEEFPATGGSAPPPRIARPLIPPPASAEPGPRAPAFPSPLIIAVYVPDLAAPAGLHWLGQAFADMLIARLSGRPHLIVIEAPPLEAVRHEEPRPGDRLSPALRRAIADLGATVLVRGRVAVVEERVTFEARIIEVERGVTLGRARAEGPLGHAPAVAMELTRKIARFFPGSRE